MPTLIHHHLRAHLPADRVLAAGPRVHYSAGEPGEIPSPRRAHQQQPDQDTNQTPNE